MNAEDILLQVHILLQVYILPAQPEDLTAPQAIDEQQDKRRVQPIATRGLQKGERLIGQAVKEPDLDFFKARQLYSRFGGSPFEGLQVRGPDRTRTLLLIAAYRDGKGLRRMLGVVRDLLALYAKNSGAQAPQSP